MQFAASCSSLIHREDTTQLNIEAIQVKITTRLCFNKLFGTDGEVQKKGFHLRQY